MSIALNGSTDDVEFLGSCIVNFAEIVKSLDCVPNLPKFSHASTCSITNKYYSASLDLHKLDHDKSLEGFEGFITVLSPSANDAQLLLKRGVEAHNVDISLRLFVFIMENSSQSLVNQDHYIEWSLDYGFEYIEIVKEHLLGENNGRDKTGLSRVMEALESNMWSTMQRHPVDKAPTSRQNEPPQQNSNKQENSDKQPHNASNSLVLEDENDEDDKDDDVFGGFEKIIAEAQVTRETAMKGGLSDNDRRANAAAMVMKFCQMLDLDDESDDEN